MNEIVTTKTQALTESVSNSDLEILKRTTFKGLDAQEIEFATNVCNRMKLDPFIRQIHFVPRKDKNGKKTIAIQVGIDGLRLMAQRSADYAGSDDAVFDNEDKPQKATTTVYKMVGGQKCAFTATARWKEYYPGGAQGFMWNKMPCTMLSKCSESLALRKAFPAELSGVYVEEEMHQADGPDPGQEKVSKLNEKMKDVVSEPVKTVEPEVVPNEPQGFGDYLIPFGRNKDIAINQLDQKNLDGTIKWLQESSKKNGGNLKGKADELRENLEGFLGRKII